MLQIDGVLRVVPASVHTESGTLRVDEGQPDQPAVVQTFMSMSGPVQVVFPVDSVDQLIEGLNLAKEEARKNKSPASDLYIPSSMEEADKIAKTQEQLKIGEKNEADGS